MLQAFGDNKEAGQRDLANRLAVLIRAGRLQARLDLVEMVSLIA